MADEKRDIKIHTEREVDVGHFIPDDDGLCKNLHGHRLKVEVEITGKVEDDGMVVNFKAIKKIIDSLDHKTIIPMLSPHLEISPCPKHRLEQEEDSVGIWDKKNQRFFALPEGSVVTIPATHSTAEVLADVLQKLISEKTGISIEHIKVRVYETPKSWAETV